MALFSISSQSYYDIGLGGDGTNPNFYAKLKPLCFNFGNVINLRDMWSYRAAAYKYILSVFLYFFIFILFLITKGFFLTLKIFKQKK